MVYPSDERPGGKMAEASQPVQGAPPLQFQAKSWDHQDGGPRADSPTAGVRTFQELLGRLTFEFNNLWASNSELRAENARLRKAFAVMGKPSNGAVLPVQMPQYAPWEVIERRGASPPRERPPALNAADLWPSEEGGIYADDEGLNPLPMLSSSPCGRRVLRSEGNMLPPTIEENAALNGDQLFGGLGHLCLESDPTMLQPHNFEAETIMFERHISSEQPRPPLGSESEALAAYSVRLYKPDEHINPKFVKQGSVASMQSELSLLPQWRKNIRPTGVLRRNTGSMIMHSSGNLTLDDSSTAYSGQSSRWRFQVTRSASGVGRSMSSVLMQDPIGPDPGICSGDEVREKCCLQRFIIKPNSWRAMIWDLLSCAFMGYELMIIPLQVFPIDHEALKIVDWVIAAVWTLDIFFSFLRGAELGGIVELRPSRIAWKYLRCWFWIDVMLVILDWMIIWNTFTEDAEPLKGLRIRRIIRIIRIVRLVRIVKLAGKDNLREMSRSERYMAILSIGKLLVVIWVVNHYVACGWYGIGTLNHDGNNWMDANRVDTDRPVLYHYTTSFHWSMTQFTPASMEVVPTNAAERIYTVCTIFVGLCVFSSFVSNMTHAMTSFQQLTSEQRKQNNNLRQFLSTHRVSMALVHRIIYFAKSSNGSLKKTRLHESDIACLKSLPENLLARLHVEIYGDTISSHPLFGKLRDVEEVCFTHICNLAMSERSLLIGEELFRCGAPGKAMYYVIGGSLAYFRGYDETLPTLINPSDWLCECALWAKWEHKGRLTTDIEAAELMCLDAAEFHRVIVQTRSVVEVQRYAQLFCTRAVLDCGSVGQISDLYGHRTTVDAITRRAFNHGDDSHLINKALMHWRRSERAKGFDPYIAGHIFIAWKQITNSAKMHRTRRGSVRRGSAEPLSGRRGSALALSSRRGSANSRRGSAEGRRGSSAERLMEGRRGSSDGRRVSQVSSCKT